MRHAPRPRETAQISYSIQQQLNMYALAAGATGVGILALAQSAEGRIAYTPTHVIIGHGGTSHFAIDLNHDGIPDFGFAMNANSCTSECAATLSAYPMAGGEGIEGKKANNTLYARALHPKTRVGPRAPFNDKGLLGDVMVGILSFPSIGYRRVLGDWNNVKNRYLGFKFGIHGKTHYGWARLDVRDHGHYITATLTGYAYETIPGKAIVAGATKGPDDISVEEPDAVLTMPTPERATLGTLALGAQGLSIWRCEERLA